LELDPVAVQYAKELISTGLKALGATPSAIKGEIAASLYKRT
jgi:hypothetical protein